MAFKYVDEAFYQDEYGGIEVPAEVLEAKIKRAEREIEALTGGRLDADVFSKMTLKNQERIKNAICSQVEFLEVSGDTAGTLGQVESFSIGSYSESMGGGGGKSTNALSSTSRYAKAVYGYLMPTGLLYGGVRLI